MSQKFVYFSGVGGFVGGGSVWIVPTDWLAQGPDTASSFKEISRVFLLYSLS